MAEREVMDPTKEPAVWWRLEDLDPWQENPRIYSREDVDSLVALIRTHGFNTVLNAHWPTRRIVRGHRRRLALLELMKDPEWTIDGSPGPGFVPVRFRAGGWDGDEGAEGDVLADNREAENGKWNLPRVAALVERWSAGGAPMERIAARTAFRDLELREILSEHTGKRRPNTVEAPGVAAPPRTADSKRGRVYQLGPHRLLCGDCTDLEAVAELMEGRPAAAVVTDPPFAIYGSSTGLDASIADDKVVRPFFALVMRSAKTAVRPFGAVYIACDWRSWAAWWDSGKAVELAPANMLIWDKGGGGLGSNYANGYEIFGYWLAKPKRTKMFKAETGVRSIMRPNIIRLEAEGDPGPTRIDLVSFEEGEGEDPVTRALLNYGRVTGAERVHNAAKPIPLLEELITASTKIGEIVLDLFGGGGSTLMACARQERLARLMEIDPAWCDVIRHRWTAWAVEAGVDPGPGALVMENAPTLLGAASTTGPKRKTPANKARKPKGDKPPRGGAA